jgi:hypothetical protein
VRTVPAMGAPCRADYARRQSSTLTCTFISHETLTMDYDRLQTCVLTLSEPGPGALPMGGIKLSFKSSVHAHAHRLYIKRIGRLSAQ